MLKSRHTQPLFDSVVCFPFLLVQSSLKQTNNRVEHFQCLLQFQLRPPPSSHFERQETPQYYTGKLTQTCHQKDENPAFPLISDAAKPTIVTADCRIYAPLLHSHVAVGTSRLTYAIIPVVSV